MTIPPDVLDTMPARPYEAVRALMRDGDILLCSARDPASRLIRWSTRSPWSHIALAFRVRDIDRDLALECVEKIGVRAVPMATFISRTSSGVQPYPGRILLARHNQVADDAASATMKVMSDFAFSRLGDRFSGAEITKIALRMVVGRLGVRMPPSLGPDDEYICSEYVARCYAQAGYTIKWDGLGFIAPADFADDPHVVPVAQIQTR